MKFLQTLFAIAIAVPSVFAGTFQEVRNFGTNPTNVQMFVYRPDRLPAKPALLIAMHYCSGTAQAYYSNTQYARLADQYGFIVVYPDAPDSGQCWDVHSTGSLTHNGGGDAIAMASVAKYGISTWGVDPARVFATGTSSGAMMTQVLMGSYPDVFAGGAAFAGVPFGCFAGPGMWNSQCSQGQLTKTAQQWGDQVRNAYPGYTGKRPKLQIWHGTNDETLNYNNHREAIKQWTNVFGYSETPQQVVQNFPVSGWTKSVYGPNFEAISAQGVPHNIPIKETEVIKFFGLDQTAPAPTTPGQPGPTTTTTTTTQQQTPTPPPTGGTVPRWGQCGGINHNGRKYNLQLDYQVLFYLELMLICCDSHSMRFWNDLRQTERLVQSMPIDIEI